MVASPANRVRLVRAGIEKVALGEGAFRRGLGEAAVGLETPRWLTRCGGPALTATGAGVPADKFDVTYRVNFAILLVMTHALMVANAWGGAPRTESRPRLNQAQRR